MNLVLKFCTINKISLPEAHQSIRIDIQYNSDNDMFNGKARHCYASIGMSIKQVVFLVVSLRDYFQREI